MTKTKECQDCDEEVMPIDGDCPLCGRSVSQTFSSGRLVIQTEDGETKEIGEVTDIELNDNE